MSNEGFSAQPDQLAGCAARAGLRGAAAVCFGLALTFAVVAIWGVGDRAGAECISARLLWALSLAWTAVGVVLVRQGKKAEAGKLQSASGSVAGLVGVLVVALVLVDVGAGFVAVGSYMQKRSEERTEAHRKQEDALEDAWRKLHSQPEDRGFVPLLGYSRYREYGNTGPTVTEAHMTFSLDGAAFKANGVNSDDICVLKWDVRPEDGGKFVVNARLVWSPKSRIDMQFDEKCHVERWSSDRATSEYISGVPGIDVLPDAIFTTDGPIRYCKRGPTGESPACAGVPVSPGEPGRPLPHVNGYGGPWDEIPR